MARINHTTRLRALEKEMGRITLRENFTTKLQGHNRRPLPRIERGPFPKLVTQKLSAGIEPAAAALQRLFAKVISTALCRLS